SAHAIAFHLTSLGGAPARAASPRLHNCLRFGAAGARTDTASSNAGANRRAVLPDDAAGGPRCRFDAGERPTLACEGNPAVFLRTRPPPRWLPATGRGRRTLAVRRLRALPPCRRRRVAARRRLSRIWRRDHRRRRPLRVQDD